MLKKIGVIFLLFLFSSCARWKENTPPPKKTILTITISFIENLNLQNGYYEIVFDNDNNIANGPYYISSDNRWSPNTTHFLRLKDNVFRFGTILSPGEPISFASYGNNKIIIHLDISIFGSPEWLQVNVVSFDKDGNMIDTLDKGRPVENSYISYNIVQQFPTLTQDNENDVSENYKHLDIKDIKIEKSVI